MTSATDLRVLESDELESRLAGTQQELFNLRFQRVTGQLDNTARIRQLRREVARMKTILREREIADTEESEIAGVTPALPRPVRPAPARPAPAVEAPVEEPAAEAEPEEDAEDEAEPEEDAELDEGQEADEAAVDHEPVEADDAEEAP
jgi:large subunit ribosomal protein L29